LNNVDIIATVIFQVPACLAHARTWHSTMYDQALLPLQVQEITEAPHALDSEMQVIQIDQLQGICF
jgi:hypothetical protein